MNIPFFYCLLLLVFSPFLAIAQDFTTQALHEDSLQFPNAVSLATTTIDSDGQQTLINLLNTGFKYSVIRTETITIDGSTIFTRSQMAADHFLVTLAPGENAQTFFKAMGSMVTSITPVTENDPLLFLVTLTSPTDINALPNALKKAALLTKGTVEPDLLCTPCQAPQDFDPGIQVSLNLIGAPSAWNLQPDASSVVVAVLDSGINHRTDLNVSTLGFNYYDNNSNTMDLYGHGTLCAGIIGCTGNDNFCKPHLSTIYGVGIYGLGIGAQLMPCKFFTSPSGGTISDEIQSIDYAINHNAAILNCSYGHYSSILNTDPASTAEYNAFKRTQTAGIIVVAAAGNIGSSTAKDNDVTPFYPSCYGLNLDNIIAVAAVDEGDEMFSSSLNTTHSKIGSSSVHLAAPISMFSSCNGYSSYFSNEIDATTGFMFANLYGTSASAAIVSGGFALLKAKCPNYSYTDLKTLILDNTDKSNNLEETCTTHGVLNIANALKKVNVLPAPTPTRPPSTPPPSTPPPSTPPPSTPPPSTPPPSTPPPSTPPPSTPPPSTPPPSTPPPSTPPGSTPPGSTPGKTPRHWYWYYYFEPWHW